MRKVLLLLLALLSVAGIAQADTNYPPDNKNVRLTSTNLPIVWMTVNGATIDRYERITARMKIIHNGNGQLNYADTIAHPGQKVNYEGYVALRYRGNSTFSSSDKKPYSFRPLDKPLEDGGSKKKVDILGMGKDNNWALLAPYSDKSMMRDILAFEISRPWMEYTPDGRYCELYLDGIYYGVYILTEVVSDGKHRLNLDEPGDSGDDLTGGYLMEVDRNESPVLFSSFHPENNAGQPYLNRNIYDQYGSPDYEDMTEDQLNYIKIALWKMESALASEDYQNPETGYAKYIDVMSFVDFQLAQELGHNVDAYRLSTKLFKRRDSEDPRFKLALWDMDQAYGGSTKYESWSAESWSYRMNDMAYEANDKYLVPFWWNRLNSDSAYTALVKQRWGQYRRSNVSLDNVLASFTEEDSPHSLSLSNNLYYDLAQYYWYTETSIGYEYSFTEKLTGSLTNTWYWGDSKFNGWGKQAMKATDLVAELDFAVTENITLGTYVGVAWATNSHERQEWKDDAHNNRTNWWGGVKCAFAF